MIIIGLLETDVNRSNTTQKFDAPPRAHLNFQIIDEKIIIKYTHVAAIPPPQE